VDELLAVGLDRDVVADALQIERLPDRHEHVVGRDDEGVARLLGPAAPGAVELAQSHGQALDPGDAFALDHHLDRGRQELQDHAFVLGFFDLLLVGGHGLARAAVGHGDFLGTQAEGRARGVDRGIAAADRHVLAHRHGSAEIAGPQEAQGVGNPFRVLAGVEADPRANGGKRVPLAVQAQRFRIAILRHQRDVAGDVHVGRASALARGMDQRRANAGAAPLVADVLHVFVAEVADRREHGVGGRLPQPAQRGLLDRFAQLHQPVHVGLGAPAFADAVDDLQHPLGADAAGNGSRVG
jgi:hypothetical protein